MATRYPSSISRELAPDSNDDDYKMDVNERYYNAIVQNIYEKHLELGKSLSWEQARVLASHLLQPNDIDAVLNKEGVQFLGLEVLNVWMKKSGSTIWVLQQELKKLGLCDSLAILENARLVHVSLCIMIYVKENNARVTHKKINRIVPGKKSLVDVVRPIVYRIQGLRMTQMEEILHLRLDRSAEGDQDNTWSSPAQNFKGEQVDIHMFYTNASERRHTDPGQKKLEGVTQIERNVISWIDEASLCFGYVEPEPATTSVSEDLVLPVQEMSLNQSMDELSLKSDISLEGHVSSDQTKKEDRRTLRPEPEADESSECPGLRISSSQTATGMSVE